MKQLADPNELRKLPRALRALAWRLPLEYGKLIGKLTYKPFDRYLDTKQLAQYIAKRGEAIEETAVTFGQRELLIKALNHTETLPQSIAEIGAWRGITTAALAKLTHRRIYAVDPHTENEFQGINEAFEAFSKRIASFDNIVHIRSSSGDAARHLTGHQFSLIFVDAIHDYINTWYDFVVWGKLLVPGGIIVFHDVDDHPGTNLACRKILDEKDYQPWGYCPNIIAFKKLLLNDVEGAGR